MRGEGGVGRSCSLPLVRVILAAPIASFVVDADAGALALLVVDAGVAYF